MGNPWEIVKIRGNSWKSVEIRTKTGKPNPLNFHLSWTLSGFSHGFLLIRTDFHDFPRISHGFPRIFSDFKQISAVFSAVFSSLQLNYIVQKMLGEKNNMPLYTKYIINRVTN